MSVLIYGLIAVGIIVAVRLYAAGGRNKYWPDLKGKIAVVTGANTGIGKETCYGLARQGATVIMCAREKSKGEAAVAEVIQRTGNQNVKFMQLDLADFSSIRAFASNFLKTYDRCDILINNAGVMMCPFLKTKDGLEMQLGVNHFGHFLLTTLLLDTLKASNARIVNVSSEGHRFAPAGGIKFDDINSEKNYNAYTAYGQSKLANILFTTELQRRVQGTGVIVSALHPGGVDTELPRHFNPVMRVLLTPFMKWIFKTPWEGAQTSLHCALAPNLNPGRYYSDCKEQKPTSLAQDATLARKLWEVSEEIVAKH